MKLSKAQLATLEAVERREVYEIPSMYTRKSNRMYGARKQTVDALREKGFIAYIPTSFHDLLYFRLTDAGKKALDEARRGK